MALTPEQCPPCGGGLEDTRGETAYEVDDLDELEAMATPRPAASRSRSRGSMHCSPS